MSETCVSVERTPITMRVYARAVALAWRAAFGAWPTKAQAGVLWAQYGVETGGEAMQACWRWNIGNVKHVRGDGHDYYMLAGTTERVNGVLKTFQPPDPTSWFRAFPNLDAAMREHFGLLRGRYGRCWPAVEAGDVDAFAHALKAGPDGKENTRDDYFTADAGAYARGMAAHFGQWMKRPDFDQALEELAGEEPNVLTASQLLEDAATVHPEVPLPEREPPPSTDE